MSPSCLASTLSFHYVDQRRTIHSNTLWFHNHEMFCNSHTLSPNWASTIFEGSHEFCCFAAIRDASYSSFAGLLHGMIEMFKFFIQFETKIHRTTFTFPIPSEDRAMVFDFRARSRNIAAQLMGFFRGHSWKYIWSIWV